MPRGDPRILAISNLSKPFQATVLFGMINTCDALCIARAKGVSAGGPSSHVLMSKFCGFAKRQQYLSLQLVLAPRDHD